MTALRSRINRVEKSSVWGVYRRKRGIYNVYLPRQPESEGSSLAVAAA